MTPSVLALWAGRLVVCLIVAAVSSGSTWAWMTFRPRSIHAVSCLPSTLTAGLNEECKTISAEFERRVKASFPAGSSEAQMGIELGRQGFLREDWSSSI